MRRVEWLLMLLVVAVALPGCKRLSFIKPNPDHRGYTQVAPDYNVRPDRASQASAAVAGHLQAAERALQAGQLEEADRQARAALRGDARSDAAHTLIAMVADRRGQNRVAGEHYARALRLAPTSGINLNNQAVWLCANGRATESLPLFQQALADPGYPTPLAALANSGSCALKAGELVRAESELRQVLQADPVSPVALQSMAELSLGRGQAFEARGFIQRHLDAAGDSVESLNLAVRIEQALGDSAAAERYRIRLEQHSTRPQNAVGGGSQR